MLLLRPPLVVVAQKKKHDAAPLGEDLACGRDIRSRLECRDCLCKGDALLLLRNLVDGVWTHHSLARMPIQEAVVMAGKYWGLSDACVSHLGLFRTIGPTLRSVGLVAHWSARGVISKQLARPYARHERDPETSQAHGRLQREQGGFKTASFATVVERT